MRVFVTGGAGFIGSHYGRDWSAVRYVPDRKGHDRRYSLDHSKLAALGYAPQTRFEDGLASTGEWYRANRSWWEPLKAKGAL
jgi:dTDP-glucose 4,6-dehydratase